MDVLGIDFGTSNTVAVLAGTGRPPRVLSIDGVGAMPSCVYIDDDGSLAVGRDAERKARLAPERFEPNPKRRIDDGEMLLGVRVVSVVDAIAAVLHRVIEEARRQLNGRSPDVVHLTHPAAWGASRQNVLFSAARAAGLGPAVVMVPEPVAAAAHFWSLPGHALTAGSTLAVYDLGGGTFDCAVVGSTANGFAVLAESGLPDVGGVDFDQALLDHLGLTASTEDPGRWQALLRPRNAADRRAARSLREDVRAAKETLSRYPQTDLSLPDPFDDMLVTRTEFEALVRPAVTRTVEVLAETIGRAGLRAEQLGGIYLVGGSSRIPLVATVIGTRLRVLPTTMEQPETAVAMGACLIPAVFRPQGRTDPALGSGPEHRPYPPTVPAPVPAGAPVVADPGGPSGVGWPGPHAPVGGSAAAFHRTATGRRGWMLVAAVIVALVVGAVVVVLSRTGSATAGSLTTPVAPVGGAVGTSGTARLSPSSASTGRSSAGSPSASSSRSSGTSGSSGSSPTSGTSATSRSPSAGGKEPANCRVVEATGLTGCMRAMIGTLAGLSCSKNPSAIGLDSSALAGIGSITTSFSTCIDSDKGFATVIFQTTETSGRDVLGPAVRTQFTQSSSGRWSAGPRSGMYYGGSGSTGISLLEWEDAELPVVAFIGATKGASAGATLAYWKAALGATTTG